jgi:hypothetical protein
MVQTSTREHAEVKAGLGVILSANLEPRIAALEKKDATEEAREVAIKSSATRFGRSGGIGGTGFRLRCLRRRLLSR